MMRQVHAGFTGTRRGMTSEQRITLQDEAALLADSFIDDELLFHHGDCSDEDHCGSDVVAAEIFRTFSHALIVNHPGQIPRYRGGYPGDIIMPAMPELERNLRIIAASHFMFATPATATEPGNPRGQGTWHAIRHARARGIPVYVIRPDDGTFHPDYDSPRLRPPAVR